MTQCIVDFIQNIMGLIAKFSGERKCLSFLNNDGMVFNYTPFFHLYN